MKWNIFEIGLFLVTAMMFSCEDYLNIPPDASISEKEVFGTYESFQGFEDQLLRYVVDYNRHGPGVTHAIGGEALSPPEQSAYEANRGNYWNLLQKKSIYSPTGGSGGSNYFDGGIYNNIWKVLRLSNMCITQLESGLLVEATDEQRDWLRGQALFYRAFFHYEFVRAFGTIPYIDTLLNPENQPPMKRHWSYQKNGKTYHDTQAVLERVAEDFEAAANYLPEVWPSPNINWGRPTKVAALGFMAKALQYSASPLFNEEATGVLDYDKDLLSRCAKACQQTINLAKSLIGTQPQGMPQTNEDGLSKMEDLRQAFATFDGTQPGTPEVLFHRPVDRFAGAIVRDVNAQNWGIKQLTNQTAANASQNYMDKFEMKDGSRYKLEYDHNPDRRWDDRDARFDFCFYTHGDRVDKITLDLSNSKIIADNTQNSNAMRKFMADGVTKDNVGQATYSTPHLRLADIYLTYAEAVFEMTGSYNTVPPGLGMTAADALNVVRRRAGQPDVEETLPFYENNPLPGSCELDSDPSFRLLYRNERKVELAYEGQYWFDIRRWKRAHLKNGVQLQALVFDVDNNKKIDEASVRRIDQQAFVFAAAHYWMPFEPTLTRFTTDWEQNPGW